MKIDLYVYLCEYTNRWVAYDQNTADYEDNKFTVKYRGDGDTKEEAIANLMLDIESYDD